MKIIEWNLQSKTKNWKNVIYGLENRLDSMEETAIKL